jgi:hypothetical protein
MSKKEKAIYQNRINGVNQKYYSDLRAKEQELENIRIAEKQKRISDSIQRVTEENLERERLILESFQRLKRESTEDSTKAIELINELKTSNESISLIFEKIKSNINYAKKNGGIIVTQFDVIDNDYSINLTFEVFNCSNKRIKYVEFKVKALNDVNDQVKSIETLTGIGFVEVNGYSSWAFEDVWYSQIISSAKIISIKLTFEDGTTKVINEVYKIIDEELGTYYSISSILGKKNTYIGTISIVEKENLNLLSYYDLKTKEYSVIAIDTLLIENLDLIINDINNQIPISTHFPFTKYKHTELVDITSEEGYRTVIEFKDLLLLRDKLKTLKIEF